MKIAVITGASSGIGREFARQAGYFYQTLDEIWVIARRQERLKELAETIPVSVRIFAGDLAEQTIYERLEKEFQTNTPDIRMLVNAAGFGKAGQIYNIAFRDRKVQPDMIELNCCALTKMTLLCLPYMKAGARILNLASAAAFCPQPSFAVYAATKSYVLSFSRALGTELTARKIFVTAVCPGPVNTEFFQVSGPPGNKLKRLVMAEPDRVVHKALCDSRAGRPVSVYGTAMNIVRLATKILPHGLILKIEEKLTS